MTTGQAGICGRYLNYTQNYDELSDVDVVLESVVENVDVKHSVYEEIEKHCVDVKAICSIVMNPEYSGAGAYK